MLFRRMPPILILLLGCAACAFPTESVADDGTGKDTDRAELLRLHATVLEAHRNNDLDAWMQTETDDYVMVNRGDILMPDKAARRERLGPYPDSTTFTIYEDLVPPIVRISEDGTLAWLIAQVHVAGWQTGNGGGRVDFEDVWAWIELYEKRDGRWLRTGNVSNRRPQPGER